MVVLAHEALAAAVGVELHVFQRRADFGVVGRADLADCRGQHAHLVERAWIENRDIVFVAESLLGHPRGGIIDVGVAFHDGEDAVVEAGLLDSRRAACAAGIVRVPVDLQTGVGCGLEQK